MPRLATGYMPDPYSDGLAVCGPEDTSWKLGGGASYSTARDLHRFARALYGGKLLSKSRIAEVFRHTPLFGRRSLSSSGAFPGAGANLLTFPDEEVTVVVLSNNYSTIAPTITRDLAAIEFGEKVESADVELAKAPRRWMRGSRAPTKSSGGPGNSRSASVTQSRSSPTLQSAGARS